MDTRRAIRGNSGEPGYKASADYVAGVMRAAGYDVTLQEYKFDSRARGKKVPLIPVIEE